jgi:maltooligosyltrehalose trehalohydrolase
VVVGGDRLPNPLAQWAPYGVHGPSRVLDTETFRWGDTSWHGSRLGPRSLIYELHVGTFTAEGTLGAAAQRLAYLADLGVSHVELLPLAAFDGDRGWGYDGVLLNAVHERYGGPAELAAFVDMAHRTGIAVILDVVHNHLGPSGNYWDRFGPFFTDQHHTPWGDAVNLDAAGSDDVRRILLDSALGWLRDYHLDGLRLDAVHELHDARASTFLEELSTEVDALSRELQRPLTLVAESDRNDPRIVTDREHGGIGLNAQWDDDVHHALHWLLTGEADGYYADFASGEALDHTLTHTFLHDGRFSTFRGRSHGRPVDPRLTPPERFVVALQTHDQIGNRASGDRLSQLVSLDRAAAGAALLFALPYVPMIFMGEEWAAKTPWLFFTGFEDDELGRAVTEGRRREFKAHGWEHAAVPDPQDPATWRRSVLDWSERDSRGGARMLAWYRQLAALRRGRVACAARPSVHWEGGACGRPGWCAVLMDDWLTCVNLTEDTPVTLEVSSASGCRVEAMWTGSSGISSTIDPGVPMLVLQPGESVVLSGVGRTCPAQEA